MADWTPPKTWYPNNIVTAAEMNTYIRDNTEYLKKPAPAVATVSGKSSNYSTTSTSFVKVSSDFDLSITTSGEAVLVWFIGVTGDTTAGAYWDIWVDGSQVTPGGGFAFTKPQTSQTTLVWVLTGLSAGAHTIELYWKTNISSYPITLHVDTSGSNAAQFGAAVLS